MKKTRESKEETTIVFLGGLQQKNKSLPAIAAAVMPGKSLHVSVLYCHSVGEKHFVRFDLADGRKDPVYPMLDETVRALFVPLMRRGRLSFMDDDRRPFKLGFEVEREESLPYAAEKAAGIILRRLGVQEELIPGILGDFEATYSSGSEDARGKVIPTSGYSFIRRVLAGLQPV